MGVSFSKKKKSKVTPDPDKKPDEAEKKAEPSAKEEKSPAPPRSVSRATPRKPKSTKTSRARQMRSAAKTGKRKPRRRPAKNRPLTWRSRMLSESAQNGRVTPPSTTTVQSEASLTGVALYDLDWSTVRTHTAKARKRLQIMFNVYHTTPGSLAVVSQHPAMCVHGRERSWIRPQTVPAADRESSDSESSDIHAYRPASTKAKIVQKRKVKINRLLTIYTETLPRRKPGSMVNSKQNKPIEQRPKTAP